MCSESHGTVYCRSERGMEEIRLEVFGSPDLLVFLVDLLSDGDSNNSRENLFVILETPVIFSNEF